jgi:hypothetical protein
MTLHPNPTLVVARPDAGHAGGSVEHGRPARTRLNVEHCRPAITTGGNVKHGRLAYQAARGDNRTRQTVSRHSTVGINAAGKNCSQSARDLRTPTLRDWRNDPITLPLCPVAQVAHLR